MGNKSSGQQKYAVGGFEIDSTISIPYEDTTPPHEIQMYRDMVTIYFGVIKKTMAVFSGDFDKSKMSNVKFSVYGTVRPRSPRVSRTMPTINYDNSFIGKLACFITGCIHGIHFFVSNNNKLIITFGGGKTYSKYYRTFKNIKDLQNLIHFLDHLKQIIETKDIDEILLCGHSNGMSSATITSFILLYLKLNGEEFVQFCTLFNIYIQNNSKVIEPIDDPTKDQLFDYLNRVKSDWVVITQNIKIFVVGTGGIPVIFFTEEQFSTYYNLLNGRYLHLASKINNQLTTDTSLSIEGILQKISDINRKTNLKLLFLEQTVKYPIKLSQFDSHREFYISRDKFYEDKLKEIQHIDDSEYFKDVDTKVFKIYEDFVTDINYLVRKNYEKLDTIIALFDILLDDSPLRIYKYLKKCYPSEVTIAYSEEMYVGMTLTFIKIMELFAKEFEIWYRFPDDESNTKKGDSMRYNYFEKLDALVKIQKALPDHLFIDTITRPKTFYMDKDTPIWGIENYDANDKSYKFQLSNFKMYVYENTAPATTSLVTTLPATTSLATTSPERPLIPAIQYHCILINGSNCEYFIKIEDRYLDGERLTIVRGQYGYDLLFDDLFIIGHRFDYIGYQILANIFNNGLLSN